MATGCSQASVNVGASSSADQVAKILPTKRNRDVWQHYDLCEMTSGAKKARCKYCGKFYAKDANSTLKNHIERKYCKALKNEAASDQQTMTNQGNVFTYNVDAVREEMANFVIQECLPFNHFDNERLTRLIQRTLQPRYTHVSRATLRRDCLKRWKQAKNVLIDYFENVKTGVNLTSDVWSAPHGSPDSYICVTAHWVEPESWLMMKRTIAFEMFDYPHTGENIFMVIDKVIQTYKLETKILSISFDNASNNTAAIAHLKLKYKPICDGAFFHSRCVAHIINLAVQDGLKVIETQRDNFKRMLRDIFSNSHRWDRYRKFCKDAGTICLGPNWDCATRWNSTCIMYEKALMQKESLKAFHDTLSSNRRVAPYNQSGWAIIEGFTKMLQVFKNATTALSGVYYPTSPITLNKIRAMTLTLSKYEVRGKPFCDIVPPMKEKLRKYFSELPPVFTCAAALNPCVNKSGVESLIDKIAIDLDLNNGDTSFGETLKSTFNTNLTKMFEVYLEKHGSYSNIHLSTRNAVFGEGSSNDPDFEVYSDLWDDCNRSQRTNTPSSELGRYTGMNFISTMSMQEFKNLDILAWWKGKEDQYPILASMARDLLTVQASTVASESAFSVSGRVISIRRTRLTPPAVEMSICLKDYLDAAERIQDKRSLEGEMAYEAELYEDEVNEGLIEAMTEDEAAMQEEFARHYSDSGSD